MKTLKLRYSKATDEDGFNMEKVRGITEEGIIINYSVYDLTEFPEDATIERELFSTSQYVQALRLGIKLAQEGYDKIDVKFGTIIKKG